MNYNVKGKTQEVGKEDYEREVKGTQNEKMKT